MTLVPYKRIVLKIGSSLLIEPETYQLRAEWLHSVIEDIIALRQEGKEVIIVSSGAVGLGRKRLGLIGKVLRLEEKQAAAACGQSVLIESYERELAQHHLHAAQILLTIEDSENRRRYLNTMNTLETLLRCNVVPIINENDTVATSELRVGDNDRLAARVAQMVEADLLILLSDIDGLYTANPHQDKTAKHLPIIENITPEVEAMAAGKGSDVGTGGMITKIEAAKITTAFGCHTLIAKGTGLHPLKNLQEGARHSLFLAHEQGRSARKQWIAGTLKPKGTIAIDAGAVRALQNGKSLLAVGITASRGTFERGDTITVEGPSGEHIATGISAFSSEETRLIQGKQQEAIEEILHFKGKPEFIHRDNLVLESVSS